MQSLHGLCISLQTGEVYKESFITNATEDSVSLDFELNDGTLITHTLDFKQVGILDEKLWLYM